MTRAEAYELVTSWTKNPNLIKHMLAVEVEMRFLARHFVEDEETWGLAGLLHDADYEMFKDEPERHPSKIIDELTKLKADPQIIQAIKAHAWGWPKEGPKLNQTAEPKSKMDWALYTSDDLSGLIIACALVRPDKKLSGVSVESILKKWKDKSFARGVKREQIEMCEKQLGVKLADYLTICLEAVQSIATKLELN